MYYGSAKEEKRFERLTFDMMEKAMCECTDGCGFVVSDRILHSTSLRIDEVFKKYTRLAVLTSSSSI